MNQHNIPNKLNNILNVIDNINTNLSPKSFAKLDTNMYIKCLIHELRTPITTMSLGLNVIENLVINNSFNSKDFLCIIKDLYRTIEYTDNILTKFCVVQDGDVTLNDFEIFNIHSLKFIHLP